MSKWLVDDIKARIKTDDRWTIRALIALYARQTPQERDEERTIEDNKVGFNEWDAPLLTSFVRYYCRHGKLWPSQLKLARNMLTKYCGQLAKIANKEI
jgi:hypothetical protein